MAKKKEENKRVEKKEISLECVLTDAEKMEFGAELAEKSLIIVRNDVELAEAADEFKDYKKGIESRNNTLRANQSALSKGITTGIVERPVECEAIFDYESGRVTVRRLDTDQVIEDREMEGLEKQMVLDYEKENKETSSVVDCQTCAGSGSIDDNPDAEPAECVECNGTGEIELSVTDPESETETE